MPRLSIQFKINGISEQIAELFNEAAVKTFPNNVFAVRNKVGSTKWYGPQVNKARNQYHSARKKYRLHKKRTI